MLSTAVWTASEYRAPGIMMAWSVFGSVIL
jgi:hypothetical protein